MNDADLLRLLADLGMDEMSHRALPLLPLVQVAWADGEIQDKERALLSKLAEERFDIGEEGARLLKNWLRYPPTPEYLARGRAALVALAQRDGDLKLEDVALEDVLELSRAVARAAGGLFGIGSISRSEADALDQIAAALDIAKGTSHRRADEAALAESFESKGPRRVTLTFASTTTLENLAKGAVLEPQDGSGSKLHVDRDGLTVGADPEAAIRIEFDPKVARLHCRVYEANRKYYVQDLESESGTWVNGERVVERRLLGGETIRVGAEVAFSFKLLRKIPKQMLTDDGSGPAAL